MVKTGYSQPGALAISVASSNFVTSSASSRCDAFSLSPWGGVGGIKLQGKVRRSFAMTVTSQPTDQPSGVLSDEKTLERIFREKYTALVEEAKTHLAESPSSAPRVVSKSCNQAWHDR